MKIVSKIIDACLIEKNHMLFNIRIKDQIQTITETTEFNKPSLSHGCLLKDTMAVKWDLSKYQSTLPSLLGLEPATLWFPNQDSAFDPS